MRQDRIDQRIVRQRRVVEAELRIGRAFLRDHVAHRHAHARDKIDQLRAAWRAGRASGGL